MSNVSAKQFMPTNTHYPQLNQTSVHADKSLELSPSMDSMNKFLKDSSPTPKENNVPMNKESLEKLFAMFEFAVKAMRSMLAGMGVLPRLPSDLDAQPSVKPGTDGKNVPDMKAEHKVAPGVDTKKTVLPGTDTKNVPDVKVEHKVAPGVDTKKTVLPGTDAKNVVDAKAQDKVAPGVDTKKTVLPGTDAKTVVDAKAQDKVAPEADTKARVKPDPEVKVMPDGRTQVSIRPDGKLDTQQAKPPLTPVDYKNKLSSDINVTVQVQNCHCPHTDEKVAPQPPVTPRLDQQPSPQPPVMPKPDGQPSPQPPVIPTHVNPKPVTPTNVNPKPDTPAPVNPKPNTPHNTDLTSPAPDDLVDDCSSQSQKRFDNHRVNKPGLRPRF
ncbi:hypothetical protein [Pseudomonas simiae]|uniref:Uncharacterized protein n=1 Tax=Pseudomonas simiae TaxID=321846 RepID=A0ABS9FZ75_9PSED|nr:hypothetical protein [Pseudomonas simiae]MCF5318093.1 hypothetical protein [Pseudomonas simiae]MCF5338010.1 hypothetical protein [Pseudomonas simiae]MCF5343433.1 hypothetical protein [Pseudomonas simiae]MCF5348389.1 hypothetical protein [Pseudomonas simiae]